jgi:formyltetrahydrofolate-dependent phosphoribosylglycinamide formyltransferase
MKRVAVLASGGGSNLQAILDHLALLGRQAAAKVVVVASDRPQSGALVKARAANVPGVVLRDRAAESREIIDLLEEQQVDIVALAGYLKLIPMSVVDRYSDWMINVHPALLPRHGGPGMYGLRVHQSVIDSGETVSGPTVHLVTHEYDSGPVLAQWPVAVLPTDDAPTLAARVLVAEHALYPRVLQALAAGETERFPLRPSESRFANPPITPDEIRRDISGAFSTMSS